MQRRGSDGRIDKRFFNQVPDHISDPIRWGFVEAASSDRHVGAGTQTCLGPEVWSTPLQANRAVSRAGRPSYEVTRRSAQVSVPDGRGPVPPSLRGDGSRFPIVLGVPNLVVVLAGDPALHRLRCALQILARIMRLGLLLLNLPARLRGPGPLSNSSRPEFLSYCTS